MKKYKNKIIIAAAVAVALTVVFWWGGDAPTLRGWNPEGAAGFGSAQDTDTSDIRMHNGEGNSDNSENSTKPEEENSASEGEENRPEAESGGHMTAGEKTALAERMSQNSEEVKTGDSDSGGNTVHDSTHDIEYSKANGMEINEETGEDRSFYKISGYISKIHMPPDT